MTAQNFDAGIGNDQKLQARFDAIADKLLLDCKSEGLEITRDDLKQIGAVKLAVFTDLGLDSADAMDAIRKGPAAAQIQKRQLLADLQDKNSRVQQDLQRLTPAQRMDLGREIEKQRPHLEAQQQAAPLTAAQEEERLAWILSLSPQQRLSAARNAGLI